mmetsp:Transcript_101482/g.262932  ORF Transcript_101482/g.262932 Transcript_101482/m.262932 type:complete len:85 (+) Transcript_101482:305-559(+)
MAGTPFGDPTAEVAIDREAPTSSGTAPELLPMLTRLPGSLPQSLEPCIDDGFLDPSSGGGGKSGVSTTEDATDDVKVEIDEERE